MMNHQDYRKGLLADPAHPSAEMLAHRSQCRDCADYTDRVRGFENRLERALRVEVPGMAAAGAAPRPAVRSRTRRIRGGLAVAASAVVAVVLVSAVWLGSTRDTLAAEVVGHMAGEPAAWTRTDVPVAPPRLEQVMAESHLHLKAAAGLVSYANSCGFRGHQVPHLVVQTTNGPVIVMVLTREAVSGAVHFDEQGYRGIIVPVPHHGSLAVLEQGETADPGTLQQVAARVLNAIEYGDRI